MDLITSFVNSVLIIDDKDSEISDLKKQLESKDIYVLAEKPENLLSRSAMRKKDLVFLDFLLNEEDDFKTILSKYTRPILTKHFKEPFPYGIVIWTKHENHIETFFEILKKDSLIDKKYTSPLFIVALDKNKYLRKGDYSTILNDIENELQNSFSAYFLINWISKISKGIYTTVSDIFHLSNDYDKKNEDIKRIVFKLAMNQNGISQSIIKDYIDNGALSIDAYKAFDELLYSNLNNQKSESANIFTNYSLPAEEFDQQVNDAASINSKLFLDTNLSASNIVIPGNVYKLVEKNEYLNNGFPKDSTKIAIELSPPCDFSQNKKKRSKLIGGFIKEIKDKDMSNLLASFDRYINNLFKADYRYFLWPVKLDLYQNYCFICFDFHCEEILNDSDINDENKFKLIFRAKQTLFADILQKYSSNKARLGISALLPEFPEEK